MSEQESTIFCLDNSKNSSKTDLNPNRLTAQKRVVESLVRGKLQLNPENSVGHLSMAGNINGNIASLNASNDDFGKKLNISRINAESESNLPRGLKIAQMVLRNRPNRLQKPRIVAFIGSPLSQVAVGTPAEKVLVLAKELKKENVKVDFVLFGEAAQDEVTKSTMVKFVNKLNHGSGGSSIAIVPSERADLYAALSASELFARSGLGGHAQADDDDPELQLALALSMQQQ